MWKNFCDAPVMCDTKADAIDVKLSYYYIGHFSRFIRPGAKRMLVSRYTGDIETAGFVNPDGGRVLVLLNRTEQPKSFTLAEGDNVCDMEIGAHSIMTLCW